MSAGSSSTAGSTNFGTSAPAGTQSRSGSTTTNQSRQGVTQSSQRAEKFAGMRSAGNDEAQRHSEGFVARTIEEQTAKLPSDVFLWSAMGVAAVSCVMHVSGDHQDSRFYGQWVAPLLIMGLYNKIVKVHGSDRVHQE